ncbi:MAG TPA: acyltransferase [Micromonosporaceae bacterium]|nr:acyltransferase [Micromonosporaceae bacterium]
MRLRVAPPDSRLAWLDALRGLAVLFVVYEHLGDTLLRGIRQTTDQWFPAGRVGVYLFFLVSGYIIPASLERKGSLRAFWVSRGFRLYPLYMVALASTLVLHFAGLMPMDKAVGAHVPTTVLAHVTMLPALVDAPMVLQVTWTLAFEMCFYLLVTALFALRWHRASSTVALGFAGAALLFVPLPVTLLSGSPSGPDSIAVLVVAALGVCIAAALRGRTVAMVGAVGLALVVVVLLGFNQQLAHSWDGLVIPAVMFTGTALYRAQQGQIPWWRALFAAAVVATAEVVTQHRLDLPHQHATGQTAVGTVVVVGVLFALGMWWGARWRVPWTLSLLGVISFSIYMVHDLVILALSRQLRSVADHNLAVRLTATVVVVALVVALSTLTYRAVERPAQALGSRINRWLDARAASARPPVPPAQPRHSPVSGPPAVGVAPPGMVGDPV